MKKRICLLSLCAIMAIPTFADVNFSGFASVVGGRVLSGSGVDEFGMGPTFLADYPLVGAYEEQWSFKPDSLFGLQISADLGEGLTATAQIVSRGANDFETKFEWAYLSYQLNDTWTLQVGKKRLPLYYYSDFFDVGYAYMWIRPPADNYTWQIFNYNGISALFNSQLGDWSVSGQLYYGSEDDPNNKLLSDFFFQEPTREVWKNMIGGVVQFNRDWFDARFTYMTYDNERYRSGQPYPFDGDAQFTRNGKFMGASFNIDYNNIILLSEINRLTLDGSDLDTYLVSAGYRIKDFTPYITYSDFDDADGGEKHNTTSIGLRWDFHNAAAFKIQYDDVEDNGGPGMKVAGDAKAISFGVDLVF